ncbi:MAG: ATP cone domain-containing protein, partial [Candidatus Omnitrophica bacterium]|nr:ATP cone domain-containing protein [Candidatus Omnitrophota bacterium]
MFKEIIKRDGRIVDFDSSKITNAIFKAGHATGEFGMDIAKKLTIKVLDLATEIIKNKIPTVEEIQDIVEEVLLNSPYKRTAKAYIIYREQHARIREITTKASVDLVDQYLKQSDWRVKENSNMGFSLQGLNNYVSSEVTKTYWLNSIYPPEIRKAYVEGDFHIHDLGCLSVYCVGWDLQDLLLIGFKGAEGKVESSPAKHFGSALGQIVNFFYTLQGECYSADTQVLTYSGWKYFYQLNEEDKIFTLNIQTNEIELQKPVRFYEFDYDGELYNFKSKKIDLLVTPNHNMLVDQYSPNYKGSLYKRKFVKAKDFNPNEHFIPKQAIWKGKKDEYFVLPGIEIQQYSGLTKKYKKIKIESKKIPMDVWLKFFGFYLAEGTTTIRKRNRVDRKKPYYEYQVRIFQNKGSKSDEFEEEVLKKLPFRYIKKISGKKIEFVIYNKQLFSYLTQFGKSEDRFIPQEIKDLDKNQLKILTEWIMKGNGYKGNGNI